jgi:hypothetical protein
MEVSTVISGKGRRRGFSAKAGSRNFPGSKVPRAKTGSDRDRAMAGVPKSLSWVFGDSVVCASDKTAGWAKATV